MVSYMREECRLRAFENRILRRIFEPKRDKNGGILKKSLEDKSEFDYS